MPPRRYPRPFARRVAALLPRLLEDVKLPPCPGPVDGREVFESMAFDDMCEDANILEAIVYVRGSTRLRIPDDWRGVLPKAL